jgi:hypothetical protein
MSIRIAMWSGPRNISTAMMRAWGNRPDTFVSDEPFYAHYLEQTHAPHPGADEVIAHGETDWRKVVAHITGPIPLGKGIWFQKQMSHHLLPHIEMDWLDQLCNCFLIREPGAMLASLAKVTPNPNLPDTGLPQQVQLFDSVKRRTGKTPPVVDSRDVLENPRGLLSRLCAAVGVEFADSMLHWPPGPRETDGVWAKHWYAAVEKTTGFQPPREKNEPLPPRFNGLLQECEALYRQLYQDRLTASPARS